MSRDQQSRSRGGGIATAYKSTLGSNITFKTDFDFNHSSFEVVQASITLQYNTLHFFCLYLPPLNKRNNITDSMLTGQLPDLDYVNSLAGFVCLASDMNIHFDNPLQYVSKHTLTTLSLHNLVHVIYLPTHRSGHIIDWLLFDLTMTYFKNLLLQTHLNQTIIALILTSMFQSLSLLPYTGLIGTLLTLIAHYLLLIFPVFQSFHVLKMQTSSVTFCAL